MTGTKKGLERVEDKLEKLLEATTSLATQIAVIITENRNSSKITEKLDKNQIEQGKRVRDHGERLIKLETQRDGFMAVFWKSGTFIFATIAALVSILIYMKDADLI